MLEPGGGFVVGGEQHLEGRAMGDLGVELAGRAEGQLGPVAGVLFEFGGDLLHRRGEIGGDRHGDFSRVGGQREQQGGEEGGEALHGAPVRWQAQGRAARAAPPAPVVVPAAVVAMLAQKCGSGRGRLRRPPPLGAPYSAMLAFSQRVRPGSLTRVVWVKPPMLAPLRLMNSA